MPFIYSAIMWFLLAPTRSFFWNVTLTSAYVVLSFVAAGALVIAITALLKSQYVPVPDEVLNIWYWTMPDNTLDCIMMVFTAQILRTIYDMRIKLFDKYTDMTKIN